MELNGKVALVTGGSGGLGQRICHALAKEGCHIAVIYASSADVANAFSDELQREHGCRAQAFQCDVSVEEDVGRVVNEVAETFGQLDILINDAAYNKAIPYKNLDDLTLDVWSKILSVNLTGPMLLCKAVAPHMERHGQGRIVNVSSVAGIYPGGSSIAYAVSKAGLNHLTRCMAVALAPHTLVNCVAPGLIEGTRATANLLPEMIEKSASSSLLQKPADKDDCANQVVTFCKSDTTTGQTMVIDSGRVFS